MLNQANSLESSSSSADGPTNETRSPVLPKEQMKEFIQGAIRICNRLAKSGHDGILGIPPSRQLTTVDLKNLSENMEHLAAALRRVLASERHVDVLIDVVCRCEFVLARYKALGVHTLSDLARLDRDINRAILSQVEKVTKERQHHLFALAG